MNPLLILSDFLPPEYGGASVAAFRYFNHLKKGGQEVVLAGRYNSALRLEPGIRGIKSVKIKVHPYLDFFVEFISIFLPACWYFLVPGRKIKIVHCFNSYATVVFAYAAAAELMGKKVIFESSLRDADDPWTILKRPVGRFFYVSNGLYLKRRIYRRADAYISKSAFMGSFFEKVKDELAADVQEIPYFVDINAFRPVDAAEKIELRKKTGMPMNALIICFAGGINERKGVDLLVTAFERCRVTHPELYMVLVGPHEKYKSEYSDKLVERIKNLGADKILLPGLVTNVEDYMNASDVYVLPSYREGFPISILEALCSGLIVIGSSIPEIAGVQLRDGENGFLFETGSPDSLESVIRKAIPVVKGKNNFVADSSREARSTFALAGIAKKYEALYSGLLSRK